MKALINIIFKCMGTIINKTGRKSITVAGKYNISHNKITNLPITVMLRQYGQSDQVDNNNNRRSGGGGEINLDEAK